MQEHCGLFFVPLSLAMLNDDSASCKKMAALAIKSLLNQLDLQRQNSMFNLVNSWITDERVSRKTMLKKNTVLLKRVWVLTVCAFADGSAETGSSGLWAVCGS